MTWEIQCKDVLEILCNIVHLMKFSSTWDFKYIYLEITMKNIIRFSCCGCKLIAPTNSFQLKKTISFSNFQLWCFTIHRNLLRSKWFGFFTKRKTSYFSICQREKKQTNNIKLGLHLISTKTVQFIHSIESGVIWFKIIYNLVYDSIVCFQTHSHTLFYNYYNLSVLFSVLQWKRSFFSFGVNVSLFLRCAWHLSFVFMAKVSTIPFIWLGFNRF